VSRLAVPGVRTRAIRRVGQAALRRMLLLFAEDPQRQIEDCELDVGMAALRVLCPTTCSAACTFSVVAVKGGQVAKGCNLGQTPLWGGHCPMHGGEQPPMDADERRSRVTK